jgi:molybdopterin synthase sulfur carrier subunit
MPKIVLASQLARWVREASATAGETALDVDGATLGAALEAVFAQHPKLKSYVLDEHGHVRHHVAVFIDGHSIADKTTLDHALAPRAEVYLLQALSGG